MKKILSIATVAVFGLIVYSSCQKSGNFSGNGSYVCTCTVKAKVTGADSTVSINTYGGIYSRDKAGVQCSKYQVSIQTTYPGVTCSLQ